MTGKYVEGSIVRIYIENFQTYDRVEFRPGPHLNVIIGPNGAGKSTIVNAICLGLAGKPQMIGRMAALTNHIKHGCLRAKLEVELFNPKGDNYVISRVIEQTKSIWEVNGRPATTKVVEECVSRLRIHVGNLCQFLPQERVSEFARMTPQELLENTEKAVAETEDLYEAHCKLKSQRKLINELKQAYANTEELLSGEITKNSRLEVDVKNYNEKIKVEESIKILKKKRYWVEYDLARTEFSQEKERKEDMMKQLKNLQKANVPLQKEIEKNKDRRNEIQNKIKILNTKITNLLLNFNEKRDLEDLTDKMLSEQADYNDKVTMEEKRKANIVTAKTLIESWQTEISRISQSEEELQNQIMEIRKETQTVTHELAQVQAEQENVMLDKNSIKQEIQAQEQELRQIQDVNNRRLEMLRQYDKQAYEAVLWLRENQHLFKSKVYEPIMTQINVKDPSKAKYLEKSISKDDLKAFVCEHPEDMRILLEQLKEKKRLKINSVLSPSESLDHFQSQAPIEKYKKWGFYVYLKDLFTAPDGVMKYLCRNYKIQDIPIGTTYTKEQVMSVIENADLGQFYTENNHYFIKRSRYGNNELITVNTELRPPRLLTVTQDTERIASVEGELDQLKTKLKRKIEIEEELSQKERELEQKLEKLRKSQKELIKNRDYRKSLEAKITQKKQSILRLENEAADLKHHHEIMSKEISKLANEQIHVISLHKDRLLEQFQLLQEKELFILQLRLEEGNLHKLETRIQEEIAQCQELEAQINSHKIILQKKKDEAVKLLDIATKSVGLQRKDKLPEEWKKKFEALPDSITELDSKIHELQAQADCLLNTDENVVTEYNQRMSRIAKLEKEKQKRDENIVKLETEIENLKKTWLPALENLIEKINKNFGNYFQRMNCAGEIALNCGENPEEYDKYGICIRVKFRDTESLKELSPFHQSGGERSVATMLYVMALQGLAQVPFRCVDEINQGMDSINERKVFELVQSVCEENTSQYFLLTPKLLPNLDYSSHVTVLCTYNGPHTVNYASWNLKKYLQRRSRVTCD